MNNVTTKKVLTDKQKIAIEYLSSDPGISLKFISEKTGISETSLKRWRKDPKIVDKIYDRFMEIYGIHLTEIMVSMIREAKLGNVRAAEFVMKQFGKMDDISVKIKVESPFMQHLKSNDMELADAEIIDETEAESLAESFEIPGNIKIPPRDEEAASPLTRQIQEGKRISETLSKARKRKSATRRKAWRKRGRDMGIEPLPPGRPKEKDWINWKARVLRAEKKEGIVNLKD
tara:strand:- start:477 stop:1169 length:693 start_codon:yes stop_codon:yes gene_type:complete